MDVKLTPSELRELLANYYTKLDDIESKVTTSVSKNGDRYDHQSCYVEFKVIKKIQLFGKERVVSDPLGEEDVKKVLKKIFENEGYTVYDLTFDSGIKESWEGYGMGETKVYKPYFSGVTCKIRAKEKVKKLGEMKN